MKRALPLVLVLLSLACTKPKVDEQSRALIQQLTEAIAQQPANMPWIYVLATQHGATGNEAEAVKWLNRLDELGWEHGVNTLDYNVRSRALDDVVARLEAREPRVNRARTAFTIGGRRDLVPEGIAYDPVDDVFYLSSLEQKKVVRVDRRGAATDFAPADYATLGMKVDAKRRLLWVAASDQKSGQSNLTAYNLNDPSQTKKIVATPGLLNDLTLLEDGSLFATDMGRGKVLRLAAGADAFEEWADDFRYPNGITVSDDQRTLYVADFRGVTRFDVARASARARIEPASRPDGRATWLNGIDGLSFDRGSLIGIQNAIGKTRVIRIHPDDGRVEILESKNPLFEIPLTGAIVGGDYYFIANPGLKKKPAGDLVMLAIPLRD
ncbi:MAG TPA: SMP-30/gluconolactonase/LRE family protein [Thermoanaerobaculia bacterium]